MIDLHTHLDLYPNALEIISRVNSENYFTLAVTTSPRAWLATKKIFSGYENIKVAVGLHPEIVAEKFNELDLLLALISQTNFIGEIGLDGSKKYGRTFTKQELIFDSAIRECQKSGGRLISIHSRAAASHVLSILKKYPNCGQPILHWFSGSITELKAAIEIKCFFSINPIMIKSKNGSDLISRIPKDLILSESDGPFTALNGKPIMPWEAINVCYYLSQIWGMSISDSKEQLKNNFNSLNLM